VRFRSALWRKGWNFGKWFTLMGQNNWSDVPTEVTAVRRRNEKSRVAILTATRELLLEHGFDRLTIEAVAVRAGVGKQTIYRWWASRPALVAEVLIETVGKIPTAVAHSDDLTLDLVAWARNLAATLTTEQNLAMLRILMAASLAHEDAAPKLRNGFSMPLHETVKARLVAEGVAEPTAQAVADAIVGGIVYPILHEGRGYSRCRAELTVRTVIKSLAPTL
jgi:AcrR family transcriptional regulator